jgi:Zn-dependent metalloprotease
MRMNLLRCSPLVLVLLAGCVGEPDLDSSLTEKVTSDGTRILRSDTTRLTAPSTDAPVTIATNFLRTRGAVASVKDINVVSETTERGGVTHVRLSQTVNGLRVHGAYARIAISEHGEVIQAVERLARTPGRIAPVQVREQDALHVTMTQMGYSETPAQARVQGNRTDFTATEELYREPSVERVAYLGEDGALRAGFLVETWSKRENQLDVTLVDGAGAIVSTERRTNNDSYKVFVEDPLKGAQIVVNGPGAGNAESKAGWLGTGAQTTSSISGNNVKSYLDTDRRSRARSRWSIAGRATSRSRC